VVGRAVVFLAHSIRSIGREPAHPAYQVSRGEHGAARWIAVFYRPGGGHEPVLAAHGV